MSSFQFEQIGVIRSPYKEKFAVPRQPGLVTSGGELHLIAPYNQADAVRGLEAFSHLWVVFVFHQTMEVAGVPDPYALLVWEATPGWACLRRAQPSRPNPVGMSLVELKGIRCQKDQVILELGSLDLVAGTPVIDIKPYSPLPKRYRARASYAQEAPQADMPVQLHS